MLISIGYEHRNIKRKRLPTVHGEWQRISVQTHTHAHTKQMIKCMGY